MFIQCLRLLSHVQLFANPWTLALQTPLTMGFPRQEYWSRLLFPSPGDLPNPGIKPSSPALQADVLPLGYGGSISRAAIYFNERKRELQKASGIVSVSGVLSLSRCWIAAQSQNWEKSSFLLPLTTSPVKPLHTQWPLSHEERPCSAQPAMLGPALSRFPASQ